jgi:hypothetical protein
MTAQKSEPATRRESEIWAEGSTLPDAVLNLGEPVTEGPEALWATVVALSALVAMQAATMLAGG